MDEKDFAVADEKPPGLFRTRSGSSNRELTSASAPAEIRGRPIPGQSTGATSERADIISPPPSSWKKPFQWMQRRPSAGGRTASSDTVTQAGQKQQGDRQRLDSDIDSNVSSSSRNNSISDADGSSKHLGIPADPSRSRRTNSSTYSIGSAIMSTSWDPAPAKSSVAGSDHGDDALASPKSPQGPANSINPMDLPLYANQGEDKGESLSAITQGPVQSFGQHGTDKQQPAARPQRTRQSASRRMSGVLIGSSTTGTQSPRSERSAGTSDVFLGVLGICALDAKARSKPSRNILNRINSNNEFDVVMFGDKIILDEEPENWPLCDYLISFFSDGFPLHKAIEYVKLRRPFSVNDLPMQTVLWDRRSCLRILDRFEVPTPRRVEIVRDGGPRAVTAEIGQHIYERTGVKLPTAGDSSEPLQPPTQGAYMKDANTIVVDGKELRKPFVEKPVSGEDHNIHIYYEGGGGRRLFRKINNKSSEADDTLDIPRGITDPDSSYIYEKFLATQDNEDVKAYTVGSHFCHAETRKSPVVDGIVKRNTHGKEVRYVAQLDPEESTIAAKISESFGQRICGFDLLRTSAGSFVIDVNGWSFVKDNDQYYNKCSEILRDLFVKEKLRKEGRATLLDGENGIDSGLPSRPSGVHLSSLKSILKSPSMSRLAGNHHHTTKAHRQDASPDLSSQTSPMFASPSFERPAEAKLSQQATLMPDLPPPVTSIARPSQDAAAVEAPQDPKDVPPPAAKSQWKLKGMVAVVRHADRTPKQKFKFTFHTKPFVDLLKGHTEEVLLVGEGALNSVQEAVRAALKEGEEDEAKLRQLQLTLRKKGGMAGTKVQIKPMFRSKSDEPGKPEKVSSHAENLNGPESQTSPTDGESSQNSSATMIRKGSLTGVTLSRAAAAEGNLELEKLQLIVKWGGEPTHSARYQSQELGENFRNDLLLLNRESLEDLRVFSSSERRVTTSALIWTAAFMNMADTAVPPDYIKVRKDLLDDSNAAKDEMDKVKKKLKGLLRKGNKAPEQFAWPENMPEPYMVARSVVELMQFHRRVMRDNFKRLVPKPAKKGSASESLAAASAKGVNGTGKSMPNQLQKDARAPPAKVTNPPNSPATRPKDVKSPGSQDLGEDDEKLVTEDEIQPRWCSQEDGALFKERWEKLFDEFCDPEKVDPGKISELHDTIKFDALHNRNFLEWIFTPSKKLFNEYFPMEPLPGEGKTEDANAPKPSARSDTSLSSQSNPPGSSQPRSSVSSSSDKSDKPSQSSAHTHASNFAHRMGWRKRPSLVDAAALQTSAYDTGIQSYFGLSTSDHSKSKSKTQTDTRLEKLRELFLYAKILFDFIGPQEYGITDSEKLEIGLLTSLPLLRAIVNDIEDMQASEGAKTRVYFTKESHIYTLLNCIIEGGIQTKIDRKKIPELDYLSTICFELYESQNPTSEAEPESFNYSIRIAISPGCHTFEPLDVQLDSKHCIGFAQRRSLTKHEDYQHVIETLRAKFHTVKLPKSFTAVNLSEKVPQAFEDGSSGRSRSGTRTGGDESRTASEVRSDVQGLMPPSRSESRRTSDDKDRAQSAVVDGKRALEMMEKDDGVDAVLEGEAAVGGEEGKIVNGDVENVYL